MLRTINLKSKILVFSIIIVLLFLVKIDVHALEDGWNIIDGYTYYYLNNETVKGIKDINGKSYHFGENSGQLKIGWSQLLDGRSYYANEKGELQFGWVNNFGKYYITKEEGMYKGIKDINGKSYHFGENSGQLKIGWSRLLDGRSYYANEKGELQFGWINNFGKYYITKEEGMYKGIKDINGKSYHFGENSGQLKIGWSQLLDGRGYYSNEKGELQFGWINNRYYITKDTGMYKGIKDINGKSYHFGENSGQLKIGWSQLLDGRSYYSNEAGELQFGWIEDTGKYYITKDEGAYKGIREIEGKTYHFGENSGQLKIGWSRLLDGRIYYANEAGELQFGWIEDTGKYYITKDDGAYKGIKEIEGKTYHFGENSGQLKIGWSRLLDGRNFYSNAEGELLKGEQFIDNNWYSFNDDYSLKTGWQELDGYTYYFYSDGTRAKYICKIAGTRYEFDANGRLEYSNIKQIADVSAHNGKIDWDTLWSSGEIDGVILRIAAGAVNEDAMLAEYIQNVKRLNIPYGVYIYSYAENYDEGRIYANFTNNAMNRYNMNPTLGVYFDLESNVITSYLTPQLYEGIVRGFVDVLPFSKIYTYTYYANTALNTAYIHQYIDWIANYSVTERPGNYGKWQYTSKGKLPGINGNVDLSIFYN